MVVDVGEDVEELLGGLQGGVGGLGGQQEEQGGGGGVAPVGVRRQAAEAPRRQTSGV